MFRSIGAGARRLARPAKPLALVGAIACVCLAAAGPASASTCTPPACLSFNYALLDAGGTDAHIVTPSTAPLTVTPASETPTGTGTADFTVQPSGVSFPSYSFTEDGVSGTITTTLANTANGTINLNTGAVTLQADFAADVALQDVGSCSLSTGTVDLSTSGAQPLVGVAFPPGESGIPTGAGAFGGTWPSLSGSPSGSEACNLLELAGYTGRGGLWVSRNLAPPSVAATTSKLKTVKARKTEKINVKLANSGGAASGAYKVCLKAPKGVKGGACKTVSNVAAGKSSTVTFKVKATKKKTKHYTLTLTATPTAMALPTVTKSLTLKVKK